MAKRFTRNQKPPTKWVADTESANVITSFPAALTSFVVIRAGDDTQPFVSGIGAIEKVKVLAVRGTLNIANTDTTVRNTIALGLIAADNNVPAANRGQPGITDDMGMQWWWLGFELLEPFVAAAPGGRNNVTIHIDIKPNRWLRVNQALYLMAIAGDATNVVYMNFRSLVSRGI